MRAVQVIRFGAPEVLVTREVPALTAGAGQAVIDVAAADVLFVETQIRRGGFGEYFAVTPPYGPGRGVAGVVSSVAAQVDAARVGHRVAAYVDEGGYAEQAVVAADELIAVPDELDLRAAAALLHDGNTAFGLLESTGIRPGEWVLVTAAGGGLGILLVQLARATGARVIAAARGKRKLDVLRELEADIVVDYSEAGWTDRVREATSGHGVDVVFDGAGGEVGLSAFDTTAHGARFSAHGAPSGGFAAIDPHEARRRGVTVRGIEQVQGLGADAKRRARQAFAEAAAGRIRPIIGRTFPLERAAAAHAAIESREVIGKTLLLP